MDCDVSGRAQPAHSIIGSIYAVRRTRTVRRRDAHGTAVPAPVPVPVPAPIGSRSRSRSVRPG